MENRRGWLVVSIAAAAAAGGCSLQLETGYKYRPLGASPTERRAYYASPFTPEAAAAEQERASQNRTHRPGAPE
jgi:hypothetical protein